MITCSGSRFTILVGSTVFYKQCRGDEWRAASASGGGATVNVSGTTECNPANSLITVRYQHHRHRMQTAMDRPGRDAQRWQHDVWTPASKISAHAQGYTGGGGEVAATAPGRRRRPAWCGLGRLWRLRRPAGYYDPAAHRVSPMVPVLARWILAPAAPGIVVQPLGARAGNGGGRSGWLWRRPLLWRHASAPTAPSERRHQIRAAAPAAQCT